MSRPSCCPSLGETAHVGVKQRASCCAPFPFSWDAGPDPCLKLCWKEDCCPNVAPPGPAEACCCPPGGRLPLGRAVGYPVTILLPVVPAPATRLRIARASTRPLSALPYYCSFFLLGISHSRDSTFRTRLNAAELVALFNSRPSLRRFSRNRVHEIRVLLPAPLHVEGSRDLSFLILAGETPPPALPGWYVPSRFLICHENVETRA